MTLHDSLNFEEMSHDELQARRAEICKRAPTGDYNELTIDDLRELALVSAIIRRRTAGPPKALKSATKIKSPKTSTKKSFDDLLGDVM